MKKNIHDVPRIHPLSICYIFIYIMYVIIICLISQFNYDFNYPIPSNLPTIDVNTRGFVYISTNRCSGIHILIAVKSESHTELSVRDRCKNYYACFSVVLPVLVRSMFFI